jgi:hypothetical protein
MIMPYIDFLMGNWDPPGIPVGPSFLLLLLLVERRRKQLQNHPLLRQQVQKGERLVWIHFLFIAKCPQIVSPSFPFQALLDNLTQSPRARRRANLEATRLAQQLATLGSAGTRPTTPILPDTVEVSIFENPRTGCSPISISNFHHLIP